MVISRETRDLNEKRKKEATISSPREEEEDTHVIAIFNRFCSKRWRDPLAEHVRVVRYWPAGTTTRDSASAAFYFPLKTVSSILAAATAIVSSITFFCILKYLICINTGLKK